MRAAEHDKALAIAERWLDNPPDLVGDLDCDECIVARQLVRATERTEALHAALEESVKLQSHYAGILNDYDGGKRMTFKNADEWSMRLLAIQQSD